MAWNTNKNRILYHGTLVDDATLIKSNGIDLSLCAVGTDFGQGFYTTTNLKQAQNWANQKVRWKKPAFAGFRSEATVMRFAVDWSALARLSSIGFGWEGDDKSDYWALVKHCRHGGQANTSAHFDCVLGPVSLWPQTLIVKDCDQISFHTDVAVAILAYRGHTRAGTPSGLFP